MTLEKTAPSLGCPDSFITNSPSQKAKYFTPPQSPKHTESSPISKLTREGLILKGHRALSRTASDNAFLTRRSASGLSSTASSTVDNIEYSKEKKSSFKKRHESGNSLNLLRNQHQRLVRNFSAKELSSFDHKKNNLLSGAQFSERGSRSSLVQSSISHRATCSGEILLDFPCSSDESSHSYRNKKPEKNKNVKSKRPQRGIQHSLSMPGLCDDLAKDGKSNTTEAKTSESKSRPFFQFFRKKLVSTDRSPSPRPKLNPLRIPRRSSNPCAVPPEISKVERTPSPLNIDRRSSNQSVTSSRLPQNSFPSTIPCTPSSYMSVTSPAVSASTSPTSVDKLPYYMSRSRSKLRRETRSNTLTPEQIELQGDHLTFEDLPVHPSIYKKLAEKTNSYPNTPVLRQKTNRMSPKTNERVNNPTRSGSRRNSMPETSDKVKNADASSEAEKNTKEPPEGSRQNLRRKSMGESSGKASSDEIFQCELKTSDAGQRKKIIPRPKSVSSFGADMYLPNTDIRVISDAEDFEYNPTDMSGPVNLSLCGCGFLGMYHLGVVSCLSQRAPSFVERIEKVGGTSAGAIMAAVLLTCSDKIEESAEHIQSLAKEIRKKPLGPLTPGYNFTRSLRYMLDDILPQDAHETSRKKLFVYVTNADTKKSEMLSDFTSRDELIEALVASCYIPVYAGIKIPTVRGKKYTDGGISNNMPKFDTGRTITVSPFDGKSDIGPKVGQEAEKKAHFINVQNQDVQVSVNNIKKSVYAFFPPKRQALQDFFEKGRYDANRFLIREGLYEIMANLQKKAVLYESSV